MLTAEFQQFLKLLLTVILHKKTQFAAFSSATHSYKDLHIETVKE